MNHFVKPNMLPGFALCCGGMGLGLHRLLFLAAVDEKNLLIAGHPLEITLWLLSAAFLALIVVTVFGLGGKGSYEANFPGSMIGTVGNTVFSVGILWTVLMQAPAMGGTMGQIWKWAGVLAAFLLVWVTYSRQIGKVPCFAAHMEVCVFLALHLVTHYRAWSGNPQLQDYVFTLLGFSALVLFAYGQTAFDVGFCRRRLLLGSGAAAIYLCTVGLLDTPYLLLYVGGIVWVWCNFCTWEAPKESVE